MPQLRTKATGKAGQKMKDGTTYIGRFTSADGTVKDWYAAAEDINDNKGNRLAFAFKSAAKRAQDSTAHGHTDWSLPPSWDDCDGNPDILNVMFNSKSTRKFKGTFDNSASGYWGADSDHCCIGKVQSFDDGQQGGEDKRAGLYVRLVRSVAVAQK